MPKERISIPRTIKESVLREFNHRCAICGADCPQIHHLDEDPANNVPSNLIPLCPNHHLSDQHDPTRAIQPARLGLFRKYRDPAILSPKFVPLFHRMEFLLTVKTDFEFVTVAVASTRLIDFVRALVMGEYYDKELQSLLRFWVPGPQPSAGTLSSLLTNITPEAKDHYHDHVVKDADAAITYCMELIRYQDWLPQETKH